MSSVSDFRESEMDQRNVQCSKRSDFKEPDVRVSCGEQDRGCTPCSTTTLPVATQMDMTGDGEEVPPHTETQVLEQAEVVNQETAEVVEEADAAEAPDGAVAPSAILNPFDKGLIRQPRGITKANALEFLTALKVPQVEFVITKLSEAQMCSINHFRNACLLFKVPFEWGSELVTAVCNHLLMIYTLQLQHF